MIESIDMTHCVISFLVSVSLGIFGFFFTEMFIE